MSKEIERKFRVTGEAWRSSEGIRYRQGYLSTVKERTVRVRVIGDSGYLTIKGASTGAVRLEFEYPIPLTDAEQMLELLCERPLIEKNRYKVEHDCLVWEVDEFFGDNAGLVVAEVELESEDQVLSKPDWVGDEVTDDARYFNASLISNPYRLWRDDD